MRDETDFARWGLMGLVIMAVVLCAMNWWYRVLPEKQARERAAAQSHQLRPRSGAPEASSLSAPSSDPAAVTGPQERVVEIAGVELPGGEMIGFSTRDPERSDNWTSTRQIFPWRSSDNGAHKTPLPPIPSRRDLFTALLLADGRLALIGGLTPRDTVALDKDCLDCPDVYVPFGESVPSLSSDVLDLKTGVWSVGPAAAAAGNVLITGMRLQDGRIFRVSLDQSHREEIPVEEFVVEIADAAFTRWGPAGQLRSERGLSPGNFQLKESDFGVDLVFSNTDVKDLRWTPPDLLERAAPPKEDES